MSNYFAVSYNKIFYWIRYLDYWMLKFVCIFLFNMQSIYEEVFSLEKEQVEKMKQDVTEKYETASRIFPEAEAEDQEFLRIFSFICLLSFDVYVKKQVIEKLIDELPKKS